MLVAPHIDPAYTDYEQRTRRALEGTAVTCQFCDNPATNTIWLDDHEYDVPVCAEHESARGMCMECLQYFDCTASLSVMYCDKCYQKKAG